LLWLGKNSITDINLLRKLTNIGGLSMTLTTINCIHLDLSHNQISDISPLIENPGISKGDRVDISHNPLNVESIEIHIPELENKGVDLTWKPLIESPAVTALPPNLSLFLLSNFLYFGLIIVLGLLFIFYQIFKRKHDKPG